MKRRLLPDSRYNLYIDEFVVLLESLRIPNGSLADTHHSLLLLSGALGLSGTDSLLDFTTTRQSLLKLSER